MENNSQAIELKGIARSLTKLGVQDGQCEDIVNLRLKDGSWRVSDDGKLVHTLPNNYTQLYVHTNVYHHLLGVLNGKLWYFADIDNDGETFTPLDTPVEICEVQGEVTIVQNGHLLTIISAEASNTVGEESINYSIFDTRKNTYTYLHYDANGKKVDRMLYPFGNVHLNLDCSNAKTFTKKRDRDDEAYVYVDQSGIVPSKSDSIVPKEDESTTYAAAQIWHSDMLSLFEQAKNENYFTQPFLAIVAAELYDGTYTNLTNPILLSPREKYNFRKMCYDIDDKKSYTFATPLDFYLKAYILKNEGGWYDLQSFARNSYTKPRKVGDHIPVYSSCAGSIRMLGSDGLATGFDMLSQVIGANLIMSLGDTTDFFANSDVFNSICIFVTPQVNVYYLDAEGYKKGDVVTYFEKDEYHAAGNVCFSPKIRDYNDIIYDLMHSTFYLLRKYTIREITAKSLSKNSFVVDFLDKENSCPLKDLESSTNKTLDKAVTYRGGYIPKVAYSYNQRLHIANYKSELFHGYPIDYFQLSNHNVKIEQGSYAVGGVLPNLKDGADFQYQRGKTYFISNTGGTVAEEYVKTSLKYGYCFAVVSVTIDTQHGESKVVRYIQPYRAEQFTNGDNANFVEQLGPLLTYPDIRAKSMTIRFVYLHEGKVYSRYKNVTLSPHPYLNISYYMDKELKPIEFMPYGSSTGVEYNDFIASGGNSMFTTPQEQNATESYPNGLKVSEVNNPFYFPNATTYQVGSAEIVALMSNAVAVGTGQTGSAPLYVFCKDGIYALLVDSSGELAYTNARIIARDVCNNANSVTPIDSGVVFTTDRGLMSIAGSEVVELGQIAEGDVFDITDTSDKAKKIMFNSFTMSQLGALPQDLLDNVDFLTFLKGSIVNYNHNERELMVSNPNYKYTYVMDRNGNWSRRNYRADEYVNNYPTSYRVQHVSDQYGERSYLYKVDTESTSLGNQMYLLSQVIKLGTIAFKQAYRLVVRGYFESIYASTIGCYVFGSYDGRQWALLGRNEKSGKFTDIGCKIAHTDVKFLRLCLAGQLSKESRIDFVEVAADGSILNTKVR